MKVLSLNSHRVAARREVAIEHQALLIGRAGCGADQGRATEFDFGTGNCAAGLVGDEDAQSADLLLGHDTAVIRD